MRTGKKVHMATEAVPAAATTRPADVGLKREIGLIGATWASMTSLIGSGWLFGSWKGAFSTGTSSILAWVIAGIAVIILALIHAELGGLYPVAGGTARFPHFAFGSVAGVSFGFFSWVQAVTVAPIEVFAVMQYGAYYWHGLFDTTNGEVTGAGFAWCILLMAIFTALNFFAMRVFNKINSLITWWKIIIPVVCIIILFTKFHTTNFNAHGGFTPFGWKAVFGALPGAGIVFAYLGFEQADQLAGEVKDPQRNLPRAIIYAILMATVIYVLLQVVFIGSLQPSTLAHGWAGLQHNPALEIGPLAFIAGAAGLGWWATILRVDAFVSPSGTAMMYETSTSRIGYGLARNRYFPPFFGWVDKRGIPWLSLILSFVFGLFFLLPFPSWSSLVGLVTGASVLMYAGAPLSLGALRKQVPDAPRPYRVPGATVLAPLAFIIASMIIYFSGFTVIWKLGVVLVIGYILIGIWMAYDKQRPPLDWRAASWLPVYLVGMGIISWQGQYSGESSTAPPLNTGHIHFWWDMLIVAVFSLVIYIWAQMVRAPREEVLELVGRQSAAPAEPTAGGAAASA
jgi:amino acid transporter